MTAGHFHSNSLIIRRTKKKNILFEKQMPYFEYEEPFQLKALLFYGSQFVKHLLQVFLYLPSQSPF